MDGMYRVAVSLISGNKSRRTIEGAIVVSEDGAITMTVAGTTFDVSRNAIILVCTRQPTVQAERLQCDVTNDLISVKELTSLATTNREIREYFAKACAQK
jgi:hypothetical protein